MENNNIFLDDLRASWHNTSISDHRLNDLQRKVEREKHSYKSSGIARKLAGGYYRNAAVSVAVILLSVPLYLIGTPLWLSILYGSFGVIMGAMYLTFANYIWRIDFMTMPVVEAISKVIKIRMMQKKVLLCGIIAASVILIPLLRFFYYYPGGGEPFIGAIVGLCIGIPIGIYKEVKFFHTSRKLLRALERYAE